LRYALENKAIFSWVLEFSLTPLESSSNLVFS